MHSNEGKEDVQNISEVHGSKFKQKALKKKHAHACNFSKPTQKDIF